MRRLALRDLRSDEGLGLIETVVSLLVFALIMTGLAASMASLARSTTLAHARAAATGLAQQLVEKARAVGGANLQNCSSVAPVPPATASFRGKTNLTVVQGTSANCVKYQTSTTQDGVPFAVTRLVLLAGAPIEDATGVPQAEKYLIVQVSWTDGGGSAGAKTYELDTLFNQNGTMTEAPAQGIRFVVNDINGNILTSDSTSWAVSITSGTTTYTDADATTAEGTYSQLDLIPGNYTCTVTSTDDASSGYDPGAKPTYNNSMTTVNPATGIISGTCSVVAGTVTDFVTTWKSLTDCTKSTTTTGTVAFTVTDAANAPLANMSVTMTNLFDNTKTYAGKTGSGGTITVKPVTDWYTYTVTDPAGNYQTAQTSYGPVCVVKAVTLPVSTKMNAVGGCAPSTTNGTLTFTVVDATTATPLSGFKVSVTNTTSNTVTALPNTTTSGVSTKAIRGGPYTYTVSPPNGSAYQGSGLGGPICLAAGETKNITVPLSTNTCTRVAGKNAYVSYQVTDQVGNPISGATIKFINMNGDGNYSAVTAADGGPPTTNSIAGVSTRSTKLSDVDPYQYIVLAPNGSYLDSDTLGPFCTIQDRLVTIQVPPLTALVNVVVSVQNNSALPWKTYQVSMYDPSSTDPTNRTTQTVTVPNCTPGTSGCSRNPSAAITFSGVKTGTWTIEACAQLRTTCNLVDKVTYTYTTPLKTYTAADPGFGELALTDETGS